MIFNTSNINGCELVVDISLNSTQSIVEFVQLCLID